MTRLARRLALGGMAAIAGLWGAEPARADASAQGTFVRKGALQQTVKIRALGAAGQFSGAFSVTTRGCIGEVEAKGTAEGQTRIVFTKRDETDGVCRITADFTPDFGSVKISEDGCLFWHGAACDFEGSLKRSGR